MRDPEALEQVWAVVFAREPHVLRDRQVREQPVILREVSDAASLRAELNAVLGVEPALAVERDPPDAVALQPGDGAQQRGLAGARTGR